MAKIIITFFKGFAFGITGIIPAVSGATIAIVLRFYYEFIEAVNHFSKNRTKNIKFLVPLIIGINLGLIIFSSIMHFLLTVCSFPTMMFFIGLIAGSIPYAYANAKEPGRKFRFKEIVIILIPFFVLLILPNLLPSYDINIEEELKNLDFLFLLYLLLVGIISGMSLVIPGISGSHIQLLFGVYPLIIYTFSSVRFLMKDITNLHLLVEITEVLAPLVIGILIGCIFMAKLIEKLFIRYSRETYCVILGLLTGSIYVLIREPIVYQSGLSVLIIIIGIVTFVLGGIVSYNLGGKKI